MKLSDLADTTNVGSSTSPVFYSGDFLGRGGFLPCSLTPASVGITNSSSSSSGLMTSSQYNKLSGIDSGANAISLWQACVYYQASVIFFLCPVPSSSPSYSNSFSGVCQMLYYNGFTSKEHALPCTMDPGSANGYGICVYASNTTTLTVIWRGVSNGAQSTLNLTSASSVYTMQIF